MFREASSRHIHWTMSDSISVHAESNCLLQEDSRLVCSEHSRWTRCGSLSDCLAAESIADMHSRNATETNRFIICRTDEPLWSCDKEQVKVLHPTRHKYTHTLTALFPRLPGWVGTRKIKPIWILLKQETVSGSGTSWAICQSAPRSRQITTPAPHHSVFAGQMSFLPPNQQHQSTQTHTHPFNGPFSGTTWVGRYQKVKTNLDFTEASKHWRQIHTNDRS